MDDAYNLAHARRQDVVGQRAFELACRVILAAFRQERDAKVAKELEQAEEAAQVLLRLACPW